MARSMACRSQPDLPTVNIMNCLEQDQVDALHPSRLTKNFIDKGLSTTQYMHSRDIKAHHGCVNAVEFSNGEEKLLMTGGDDKRVLLWRVCELMEGKTRSVTMESLHESNIFSLAFSSDNAFAYSAGNDGLIKKHDVRSTKCIQEHVREDLPAINSLSAHPSCPDVVLSASEDGSISLLDTRVQTGPARTVLVQTISSYQSVCFNPVEPSFIAVGNAALGAALYDMRMKQKLLTYHPSWHSQYLQDVTSISFNWSGTRLVTFQRQFPPTVFSIHESKALYQLIDDTGCYSNAVTMKSGCFLGPNDEFVASGSDDFRCYIWKVPHGGTIVKGRGTTLVPHLVLPGHRSIVNQVRYSTAHHLMCTSGVEKVFKLWSHLPLHPGDKIQQSMDPPTRERHSHLEFLDMDEEDRDTSEEDNRTLALFDALIEQEEMLYSSSDSSSTDSSQEDPNYVLGDLSLFGSNSDQVDEEEEDNSSDQFPVHYFSRFHSTPSDLSPANTSSLDELSMSDLASSWSGSSEGDECSSNSNDDRGEHDGNEGEGNGNHDSDGGESDREDGDKRAGERSLEADMTRLEPSENVTETLQPQDHASFKT